MVKDVQAPWVTSESEIGAASNQSLYRSLLTSDGRGGDFKALCLKELLRRAVASREPELDSDIPS